MSKPKKGEAKQDYLRRCTGDLMDRENMDADEAFARCNAYWNDEHSQRAALSLATPVELQTGDEDQPDSFLITAYTGQVIDRGWWGKLVIDTAGIRTKAKLPVLREHARDRVVGFGVKTWKDGATLFIRGDYSGKTRDAREVRDLAQEGFPWQASVGVWPKKVKMLESDKEELEVNGRVLKGPLEIWTESEVKEVSFVALGADDETAAINFAQDGPAVKVHIERGQPQTHKEEVPMAITLSQMEAESPELLQEIRNQAREEGAQAERSRVLEILGADGDPEVCLRAIEAGTPAADTFKLLFAAEKAKRSDALAHLKDAAPASAGPQAPSDPPPKSQKSPDDQLAEMARVRAREKKIDLEAATLEICAENPQLMAQWNPAAGMAH
jgi:hypothetical protein